MKRLSSATGILTPFLAGLLILAGSVLLYLHDLRALQAGVQDQARQLLLRDELQAARSALLEPGGGGAAALAPHLRALDDLAAGTPGALPPLAALRQAVASGTPPRPALEALAAEAAADEAATRDSLARLQPALRQRLWLMLALGASLLAYAGAMLLREVLARSRLGERLRYEATHDSLTGLANRRFFLQWTERALARARREHGTMALVYVDLDGFHRVNDGEGQEIGDRLLRVAGQRFRERVRSADVLARFGSDEFVILTPLTAEPEAVGALAERLIASLEAPLLPQFGERYPIGASIGIAIYPRDAQSADALIQAAGAAMRVARAAGSNQYRFAADDGARTLAT